VLTDEELFEDNIMPKLQAEYYNVKDHGGTNYEFVLERVREFLKEGGGFGIKGWDDKQIRDKTITISCGNRTNQKRIYWNVSLD
jgi:hypothetical protein